MSLTFQDHVTSSVMWPFASPWAISYLLVWTVFRQDAPFNRSTYITDDTQTGRWTQHCSISATTSMVIYKVVYSSLWDVHLRASGPSPAIRAHTVIPATRHKWMHSALTTARPAGAWFTYPGGMEGWVHLSGWLHTDMVYPPTDGHLSKY